MDDVISKAEMIEIEPTTGVAIKAETPREDKGLNATGEKSAEEPKIETAEEEEMRNSGKQPIDGDHVPKGEEKKEEKVHFETEPKTGVTFPVKLDDGKQLNAVGIRKKSMLGIGIKIYGFGILTIPVFFSTCIHLIYDYKTNYEIRAVLPTQIHSCVLSHSMHVKPRRPRTYLICVPSISHEINSTLPRSYPRRNRCEERLLTCKNAE